jgi:hypothetical protein
MRLEWDAGDQTTLMNAFRRLGAEATQEWTQAVVAEAEAIIADAKENYVPVASGALRASGQVQQPSSMGARVEVVMGFGGASVPYALYIHENLEINHAMPHRNPETGRMYSCMGQAKYLETPFNIAIATMPGRLVERMQAALIRLGR